MGVDGRGEDFWGRWVRNEGMRLGLDWGWWER